MIPIIFVFSILFLSLLLYTRQTKDTHFCSSYQCYYTQNKEKTHISVPLFIIAAIYKTDKGHTFPLFLSMLLHTKQRKDTHFRSSYQCCYTQNKEKTHISALLIDAAIHKTKKRRTFLFLFLSLLLYTRQTKDTHFRSSYQCCYTQNKEKTHISVPLFIIAAIYKRDKGHTFPLFLSMLLHTKQRKDTHFRSSYQCCYTQNKEKTHISVPLLINAAIYKTDNSAFWCH